MILVPRPRFCPPGQPTPKSSDTPDSQISEVGILQLVNQIVHVRTDCPLPDTGQGDSLDNRL